MQYITEIKAFYDLLETNPLPSPAIALWHALMHIANKTGWQVDFAVAVSVLSLKTGLNKMAIVRARNTLEQAGYIRWRKQSGNQAARYTMISLMDKETHQSVAQDIMKETEEGQRNKLTPCFVTQSVTQPVTQSVTQPVTQSVTINRHRQDKDKYNPPLSPQGETNRFKGELKVAVDEWLAYKRERRQGYKPTALKSLCTQIANSAQQHGDQAVVNVIRESMACNYQGIMFDRLKKQATYSRDNPNRTTSYNTDAFEHDALYNMPQLQRRGTG